MNKIYIAILAAMLVFNGCARVVVTRLESDDQEGIRFYRPHPYLLVTADEEGKKLQTSIIYLPDKKEEYVLSVKGGWGVVETDFTITDGWNLTGFKEKRDPKLAETLTGTLSAAATVAGVVPTVLKAEDERPLKPGLYRLDYDDADHVVRFVRVTYVDDPIPYERPEKKDGQPSSTAGDRASEVQ